MAIDWSMGRAPDIIGNALNAFEQGKVARREEAGRNALATLVQNPNDTGAFGALAQADPNVAMQFKTHQAQMARQQQEQAQAQLQQLARIARAVKADPSKYAMARQTALQMGMKPEDIPEQYDPAWVDQNVFYLDVMSDPEKLTTLMQNVKAATGFEPGSPQFQEALRREMEAEHMKTIPFAPGGGVIGYNSATGQIRNLVTPNPGGYAPGAPAAPQQQSVPAPQSAQDYLRQHPNTRGEFDRKYGAGAAARVLGGGVSNGTGNFPASP